jgi:tetratricopeptide (TPR) repeat protein
MQMIASGDKSMRAQVDEAMTEVPKLKVRYAGKTIPPEKYAITKANLYISGNRDPVLPAFELFYVWNVFAYAGSEETFKPIMALIETNLEQEKKRVLNDESLSMDKYCFLLLLRGVCLRHLGFPLQAADCMIEILENEQRIEHDTYISPHAAFELGLSYAKAEKFDDAKTWLERARTDYTGFLIESMVHLRVHGALHTIKKLESATKTPRKPGMLKRFSMNTMKSISRRSSKHGSQKESEVDANNDEK